MPMLVFVFGTLKEGFPNFDTNRGSRIPGSFKTRELLPLYLVGERRSPWLLNLPGTGHQVHGQVFAVNEATLKDMDALERIAEADGYQRILIEVQRIDGDEILSVYAYLKEPLQLSDDMPREGPFAEYRLEHAARYLPREI
jgi:gamma-glutamylaminecyclotransferase